MAEQPRSRRVGILGFGQLGQFLVSQLLSHGPSLGLSLSFVWARRGDALATLPPELRLSDLSELPNRAVDLVVEVAHPCVAQEHGEDILRHADFMLGSPSALADSDDVPSDPDDVPNVPDDVPNAVPMSPCPQLGSPSALADPALERSLRAAAARCCHTLYVPRGALWGAEDIARMDSAGTLQALKVTMTKAPGSFRPQGWLRERLVAAVASGTRTVLYEGPVRPLCPLVPNNVNTMAAAALAAPRLGFDGVTACLVADPSVPDWHLVDVEVTALAEAGRALSVTCCRRNPAGEGAVTGSATRHSFWSSVIACTGHGGCVKLC